MKKTLLLLFALVNFTAFSQLQEGFEGTTWPPAGWNYFNVSGFNFSWGPSEPGNASQPPYEGNYAAYMPEENVATGMAEDWLVTPQFTVPENGVLSFYSLLTTEGNQNTIFEVKMHTGPLQSEVGSYILLEDFTEAEINPGQPGYSQTIIDFPSQVYGQQVYLAFVMKGDSGDGWLLDNVSIATACPAPTGLEAINVTPTSATLHWDSNDATQWEIEFVPEDLPFSGEGEIVDENYYDLSDVIAGSYKFTVRAICNGNPSMWAEPVTFTTILNSENRITGVVQYDAAGSGGCTGGTPIPFMEIEVEIDNSNTYSTYTNAQGEFTIYNLPDGVSNITLQAIPPAGFGAASSISQNVTFTEEDTEEVINICLAQPAAVNDLSVTFSPVSSARPDFNAGYMLTVSNMGTTVIDQATVTVTFDDNRLNFISAGVPVSTSANTLTFTVNNIMPFSQVQHDFTFYVLAPEINNEGDILNYMVSMSNDEVDETPDNNTAVLNQILVNSLDPNDMTVHEGPQIYLDQADDYLTYTIRFQNTGSADAITVKLENEFDPMLDSATFEPIMASHDFTVERSNNGLLFTFEDINLPSSTVNEEASHGYVTYRVKPTEEFGLNDVVLNTANIYFDANAAIATNTVTTLVIENLGLNNNTAANVALYPNPVNDRLNITLREGNVLSSSVTDINGRTISIINGVHNVIDTAGLSTGIYFVTITTDTGSSVYKIIKK